MMLVVIVGLGKVYLRMTSAIPRYQRLLFIFATLEQTTKSNLDFEVVFNRETEKVFTGVGDVNDVDDVAYMLVVLEILVALEMLKLFV